MHLKEQLVWKLKSTLEHIPVGGSAKVTKSTGHEIARNKMKRVYSLSHDKKKANRPLSVSQFVFLKLSEDSFNTV